VEKGNHAVRILSRVLQVSRAAYDHWHRQPLSERAQSDAGLTERISAIHARSRQTYGAPRVRAELQTMGHCHSRKRVARLMRLAGLAGRYPRRFRRATISDPLTVIPDLVQRNFAPTGPNQLCVGDITYIRTWEGWLYLAVLLDCYSRLVVGWSMADHLRTELPLEALRMALARRRPAPQLIPHTDCGCQPGFKGSSPHLNDEELRCKNEGDVDRVRLVAHLARGIVTTRGTRLDGDQTGSISNWTPRHASGMSRS
jgi:transposase InsO family protein